MGASSLDESPHCYKRLPEVLAAQGDTVRVLHTLTPLGVAMAGANEFDPLQGLSSRGPYHGGVDPYPWVYPVVCVLPGSNGLCELQSCSLSGAASMRPGPAEERTTSS